MDVDYRQWDWLPGAATEAQAYLTRLLSEGSIRAHSISARAKSIASFQEKCARKNYQNPSRDVTDTVAVRIITYSTTDMDRAVELIRQRFQVKSGKDRNPGERKEERRRGYYCHHLVVERESATARYDWLIVGGDLAKYFEGFGGLEIQVRTVAAHAWAEFEHSRRYKGESYAAVGERDQATIDQLFGAASDSRRALDETFAAIDRLLANPTTITGADSEQEAEDVSTCRVGPSGGATAETVGVPIDAKSLATFLAERFPFDHRASEQGLEFGCELVTASGLSTIEDLSGELDAIDSERVKRLMDIATVTRVRRLDDELLARFREPCIEATGDLGNVPNRRQQLEWRYDRLRDKVPFGYRQYELTGSSCPGKLRSVLLTAAGALREAAQVIAVAHGTEAALMGEVVTDTENAPPAWVKRRAVPSAGGGSIWVATNLGRPGSERAMRSLLAQAGDLDLQIVRNGTPIATAD